jgi:hypothetical protein
MNGNREQRDREKLMTIANRFTGSMTLLILLLIVLTGCKGEETVSFSQDVKPILDKYCIDCHKAGGEGYAATGFSMESYEAVMVGTRNGPMVIANDSAGSNMLVLMEGRADPSISMPHGKMEGATGKELETIRLWIDQGAQNN